MLARTLRADHWRRQSRATTDPTRDTENGALGPRFEQALAYAVDAHREQLRKGTQVPYVSHVLAVAALVIEDGGNEDEAIAALLHDTVEDQGGAVRLADIKRRFGETVAEIVEGCSDTDINPKPPWRERKETYISHLAAASESVLRVSLADKLHNARAILMDFRRHGPTVWERFNPEADQLWYYAELVAAFRVRTSGPMLAELERTVDELRRIAAGTGTTP